MLPAAYCAPPGDGGGGIAPGGVVAEAPLAAPAAGYMAPMHPEFWHKRWEDGQIGFHLPHPNPTLTRWWPTLGVASGAPVLVPLCGKSQDLAWLAEQSHDVLGVELSPLAVDAFFAERGVVPKIDEVGPYRRVAAEGITLLNGDFFALPEVPPFAAVYDRASLVALPPEMRQDYAKKLTRMVPPGGVVLLVAMNFPQEVRPGPPHAVTAAEVDALYAPGFELDLLETIDLRAAEPERYGTLDYATEEVWRMRRRDTAP